MALYAYANGRAGAQSLQVRPRALRRARARLPAQAAAGSSDTRASAPGTAGGCGGMIEELLPPGTAAVETREDRLDIELFAEEEASLGEAVEKRRIEFVTARACAREALARLGLPAAPIATGERGQPLWPEGVVGSITHCAGYRACALAHAHELAAVGIDAEPNEPLPAGVLGVIARPEERSLLAELARGDSTVRWDRLLFSAKESVYKVWFPIARSWLGCEEAALRIDPLRGTFQARLLAPWPGVGSDAAFPPRVLDGRWLVREGLVLSAIALARDDRLSS
jgi:4'-phosphopantetheinyl transferase EntD